MGFGTQTSWRKISWICFWIFVFALAVLTYGDHRINLDEGVTLNAAWQMWHGQQLYTTVTDFTAPGAGVFVYLMWLLAGSTSYMIAKLAVIAVWLLSAVALADITKRLGGKAHSQITVVLVWLLLAKYYPIINHNSISSYVAVIWLWWAVRYQANANRWWWVGFGLMTGMVGWFLQTKGLLLYLGSLVAFRKDWKQWVWYHLGGALIVIMSCIIWPLTALWHNLVILPFQSGYLGVNQSDSGAVALLVAICGYCIYRAVSTRKATYRMLAFSQVALAISTCNLVDFYHVALVAFPTVVMMTLDVVENNKVVLIFGATGYSALVIFLISQNFIFGSMWEKGVQGYQHLRIPQLQTANAIYAGPFLPNMYYELGQPNYFPQTNNATLCINACADELLRQFKSIQPNYVWLNYVAVAKYGYSLQTDPIGLYVEKNYQKCSYPVGDFLLYTNATCPTNADLGLDSN